VHWAFSRNGWGHMVKISIQPLGSSISLDKAFTEIMVVIETVNIEMFR
jgi:hypothetical protein